MYHLLLIAFLLYHANGYPCGQCICTEWQNTLSCTGPNTKSMPSLNNTYWIYHVDVINTTITDITPIATYLNIQSADIRSNNALDCNPVLSLTKELYLVTDCDDRTTLVTHVDQKFTHDWLNLIAVSPIVFILFLFIYLKRNFKITFERQHHSLQQTEEHCLREQLEKDKDSIC